MKSTLSLGTVCLLFATCAGSPAPTKTAPQPPAPSATTAALVERLAEGRRLLTAGDPDAALAITDRLTREHADARDAWLLAGDANLALAQLGRPSLDPDEVRRDAERAFAHALDLDANCAAAWLGFARLRRDQGDGAGARAAAQRALELGHDGPAAAGADALALMAACDLESLVAMRQAELDGGAKDDTGQVPLARATLELAQRTAQEYAAIESALPDEGFPGAAQVFRWIGQDDRALAELERGIRTAPTSGPTHLAYQDLHVGRGDLRALRGAYARFVRENPSEPLLLWYQGRAQVLFADEQRGRQDFQAAIQAYGQAIEAFGQYAAMMPVHKDTAGQWLAICELSIARAACDMGDTDAAQQHLFRAADASPLATEYDGMTPRLVDTFGSHFAGVVFAIGSALSGGDEAALRQTIAFHDAVIARCPGKWGFLYNNAALPARDLGVRIAHDLDGKSDAERQRCLTEAMGLWEKSYRYYSEAARLAPDDPRIQNDCGLMLVYHLNREFDRARELFDRAIAVGQEQLDALLADTRPADVPQDRRQFLEEAIGDAYQNIGILLTRHLRRPFAEARPFYEKALGYYPHQQREAARLLAAAAAPAPAAPAAGGGATDAAAAQGGSAEALQELTRKVEAAARDGDLDAAMAAIDAAQKELKGYAPYQLLRGRYALRYALAAREQNRKGVELLFADAVDALGKAVELDGEPIAPRQLLAEARYEQGEFAAALRTASELVLHMQSLGGGKPEEVAAVHRVRANAAAKATMLDPQNADRKQWLDEARVSFRWLEKNDALDAGLTKAWADLETTAQAPTEAVGIMARALARSPDDAQLLAAVVDTAIAAGQPGLAVDALGKRADATGLWYLGRARFVAACDLRIAGKLPEALAEIDRAAACFEQSMQKNRDYADSCQQWQAICLGKKGNVALAQKDWAKAEQWLFESVRLRPDQIAQDLGLQETTKRGVMLLAEHFRQQDDLAKVEAIYSAVAEHALGDVDLLNNAALFARDLGIQLDGEGKKDAAMAKYELSYSLYGKAAALDPQNVQLRNDLALMAIQYLGRDWERSKELLDAAVADGERMLAEYPANDADGRQRLDSAVGDCWENIAQWHLLRDHDAKAAKEAAEKSLQHFPGQQRGGARRHLRAAEQLLKEQK